jgi:hypothetical protein
MANSRNSKSKKSEDERKKELGAPSSADIGDMERIDPPESADPIEPKKGDPEGRTPAGQSGPFNESDVELIVGEDSTKPEGKREQSIYVEKDKD